MRNLKVFLITIMTISLLIIGGNVLATSTHITNKRLIEEEEMTEGVLYQYYKMDTSLDPNDIKMERDVYTYTIKQSEYAHLATWTYSNPDDYTNKTLEAIAYDYEKQHPGWIVLGGVNAEGYYNGELTNAFVQDGDVIRKDVSAEGFKKLIGFKEDGSVVIKQVPATTTNPLLKIDDQSFDVTKINALPEPDGISIITKDLPSSLDVTGYNVIEVTYSLFRTSNEFPNPNKTLNGPVFGIFIKGKVERKVELKTISQNELTNRRVYIITNKQNVLDLLTSGKEIKCEFDYTDEFQDVVSMTGYMYRYLQDGVTIPTSYVETNDVGGKIYYNDAYCLSTSKERAGIGFKKDGSIVLLTSNTNRGGPTQYEVGEMFREMGCTDAYQFDGGGSVTFLKRDAYGKINMLNTPGDGSPRSIMSGVFIVTRDPGLRVVNEESDPSKITFELKDLEFMTNASDVKVTLNNQDYLMNEGKIVVTNLEENTIYNFDVAYSVNGKEFKTKMQAATKKYNPGITITPTSKGFIINLERIYADLFTSKIKVYINGRLKYEIDNPDGNLSSYIIDDLKKNQQYRLTMEYEITAGANKYIRKAEEEVYQTNQYDTPVLKEFSLEEDISKVILHFDYDDKDNRITDITLFVNDVPQTIALGENRYTLDFEFDMQYKYQLVIKYLNEKDLERSLKSDIIKFSKPQEPESPTPDEEVGETKKGCKKDLGGYLINIVGMTTLAAWILKKKK